MRPVGDDDTRYPDYAFPWRLLVDASVSLLCGSDRSVAADATRAVAGLGRRLFVAGDMNIPRRGPFAVVCNHYSRPGFGAWWIAIALSGAVARQRAVGANRDITWVMTEAWTFPDSRCKRRLLTPVSRRLFRRIAAIYGFVPMPAMPPDPSETAARATAVRRVVGLAKRAGETGAIIGLAPVGMDTEGPVGTPPPGSGRFLGLLVEAGLAFIPAGVVEARGRLCVSFGEPFMPAVPVARRERDHAVAQQVMAAILLEVERARVRSG
jgi:hypothetical protein